MTRDVIFEERRAWSWETFGGTEKTIVPTTFTAIYSTETSVAMNFVPPAPMPEPIVSEVEPQTPASMPKQSQWAMAPMHDDTCDIESGP